MPSNARSATALGLILVWPFRQTPPLLLLRRWSTCPRRREGQLIRKRRWTKTAPSRFNSGQQFPPLVWRIQRTRYQESGWEAVGPNPGGEEARFACQEISCQRPWLSADPKKKEKDPAASWRPALNETCWPNPHLLSPTDYSGKKKAYPSKGTWAAAAAQRPNSPTLTLTLRKTVDKSLPVPLSTAPTDNCKGRRVEGALSRSGRIFTPLADNSVVSLAPTAASPTSLTDNYGDITRERPVDATPHTLPPTLPNDKLGVSTTSPPASSPTYPTDTSGDGTRDITRREDPNSPPLTTPAQNPGAPRTPISMALSTPPTDNPGVGLKEQEVLNAIPRAKKKRLTAFQPHLWRRIMGT